MMKYNLYTKIFRQLRGYFIRPHLNVWRNLRNRLFNKNSPDNTSKLKDFKKEPPPELFAQVLHRHEQLSSKFAGLKDHQLQPGKQAFDNILDIIKKEAHKEPITVVPIIPFYKKIIAAAALLLVLLSCFFILKTGNKTETDQQDFVTGKTVIPSDSLSLQDSLYNNETNQKPVAEVVSPTVKRKYFNATNYLSFYNITIGNSTMPVENNDLLYSFTKYPYRFGQPNPWNQHKQTVVKINDYSGINVSPYMSSVISDLYKVKSNGRSTTKARKAKQKITRWRKTDAKRFDKKKNKNPLDIIDLGENVY